MELQIAMTTGIESRYSATSFTEIYKSTVKNQKGVFPLFKEHFIFD